MGETLSAGATVLVTGASGFIGSNLVRRLLELGTEVHATLRLQSDSWRLAEIEEALHLHRLDIRDAGAVKAIFGSARPRLVCHLAMPQGHPRHADERAEAISTALGGTLNLLEASCH